MGDRLFWGHTDEVLARPLQGGAIDRVDADGALGHMAWDADYVYFPRNGIIARVPLDGGASDVIYTGVDSPITALAVAGGDLYFTLPDSLRSIPKAGGASAQTRPVGGSAATPLLANVPDMRDVFVDGQTMWLTQGAARTVVRTGSDGKGALQIIAVGQVGISQIVVTGTSVYWAAGSDGWTMSR